MRDRFAQLQELFHGALSLAAPERRGWLERETRHDPTLLPEVERLLAAEAASTAPPPAPSGPQTRFGPYRVLRLLGRGGMGAVFLAERADGQYRQQVALKILAPHLAGTEFSARFSAERQMLTDMDHPNIVRLLDGGVGESGEPYLVTEYVGGQPIDAWCDQMRLDVRARLQLLMQVCTAVEQAHQRLVLHRDLKPGNIMVNQDGVVKLLDFGTAKLLTADGQFTATTSLLLTPRYASPEQMRNDPLTIASDVYSLGLVLYDVLAGHRPFPFDNDTVREMARATQDLPLQELGTAATAEAAAARGTTLPALQDTLRGDLAAIAAKAVAFSPRERYQSVQDLREDLAAVVESRPVRARPATFIYRARKFAYRRRRGVAAAAALVAVALVGVAATLRQAHIADRRFEDVRRLAHYQLFELYDQASQIQGTTRLRADMAAKSLAYLDGLAGHRNLDRSLAAEIARGYGRLGDVYGNLSQATLGKPAQAMELYRKGLAVVAPWAKGDAEAAHAQIELETSLATAELASDPSPENLKAAVDLADRLQSAASGLSDDDTRLLLARARVATFIAPRGGGWVDRSEQSAREAEAILSQGAARAGPLQSQFQEGLLQLYFRRANQVMNARPREAHDWVRRGLDLLSKTPEALRGTRGFRLAEARLLNADAGAFRAEAQIERALESFLRLIPVLRELSRDEDDRQAQGNLALALANSASCRWDLKDLRGYVADVEEALALTTRLANAGAGPLWQSERLTNLYNLAFAHDELKSSEAAHVMERAVEELKKASRERSLGVLPKTKLADLLLNVPRFGRTWPDEALPFALAAATEEPDNLNAWESIAEANRQMGRYDVARNAIDKALTLVEAPKPGEEPSLVYQSLQTRRAAIVRQAARQQVRPSAQ